MSYQALARKWRPRRFDALVGQAHVVRALTNALDNDRLHHAYLFTGTRGVGKTTVARILAKALNCARGVSADPCGECEPCQAIDAGRFVDLIEVDAASRTRVDETRELLENVPYAPSQGRFKVYLIDEVHMFSTHSFNALLKTLEEPPEHVKFLLATTDPKKLPVTILSRCLQFHLKRLPREAIAGELERICAAEQVSAEPAALAALAVAADGSMRDALSLLDQAIAFGGGTVRAADVATMLGTVRTDHLERILRGLAAGDGAALLAEVAAMAELATDFEAALAELIGLLHRIAVAQVVRGDGAPGVEPSVAALAAELPPEDVQLYYQLALVARRDLPLAPDPREGFEMLLLRMLAFTPEPAVAAGDGAVKAAAGGGASAAGAATAASPSKATEARGPEAASTGGADAPRPARDDAVDSGWAALLEALPVNGLARELAAHCVLLERSDTVVRLALPQEVAHLRSPSLEQRLETALRTHLGAPVALRIEVRDALPGESPAAARARAARQARQAAESAIAEDPFVRELQSRMDAVVESAGPPEAGRAAGAPS